MDYRMPWRSIEPLKTEWDGDLFGYVEYTMDRVREAWDWDNPAQAKEMTAALTPSQLALWAVLNADGQVCNGGFSQFFYNSYGELAEEALQGFRLLGMPEYADLFEQAYSQFAHRPIPKDRKQRIAILDALTGDSEEGDAVQVRDPEVPEMLVHYSAMAKGTEALWGTLESSYYALIDREDVPGGYNAAFFHPLAVYIESHPHEFFLPKLA